MCCSAASLQLSVHFKYQSDLQLSVTVVCYLKVVQYLFNTLELQVRMKFGVVSEVSTFLVITQVSSGFKNCIILIFRDSQFSQYTNPVSPQVQFINVWPCMYSLSGLQVTKSFLKENKRMQGWNPKNQPNQMGMTPQHFHTIPTSCAILPPLIYIIMFVSCVQRIRGCGRQWGGQWWVCIVHFNVHGVVL